ncbi:MAG: aryl-sulfate sulfotransferase [Solirubrobacterales bacterium]|nr:aryl-sulfate sulfotransferase [Solirubrobacterales bacterium]
MSDDPRAAGEPGPSAASRQRVRWMVAAGVVAAALAGGVIALLESTGGRAPPRGPSSLVVLPFPGTPAASPRTQITFPALAPAQVRAVAVDGSRSGAHAGRLTALVGGRGTAFSSERPFAPGERVSVAARLSSPAAGTASGAPNATELRFSFTVAAPPPSATTSSKNAGATAQSGSGNQAKQPPTQSFHSQPNLRPPVVEMSGRDPDRSSGDIFVDAHSAPQNGPMILDSDGRLVWFDPLDDGSSAFNFRVQTYAGRPVLTFWKGQVSSGHGAGEDLILNRSYQTLATVHASEGYQSDLHEFQITPEDTALITAYQPVKADLSSVGGPQDGAVFDCIAQEIDIGTDQLLWEWHALGHVPLSASYAGKPTADAPYDYFHMNSIEQLPDGNLLISARNTWAVYEIDRDTGKIVWTLGGKESSFTLGSGVRFEWQHDARLHPDGTITLFDDAASPQEESQSRAIQLKLDMSSRRASLVRSYTHTPPLLAGSQGNMQVLSNANVFVGWGAASSFSEHAPGGTQMFGGSFPGTVQSYRAYRSPWSGQPTQPPAISVTPGGAGALTAYASWNGATNVTRWELLSGPSPTKLSPLAMSSSTGFETMILATTSQPYLAVRALTSSGRTLGTSAAVSR